MSVIEMPHPPSTAPRIALFGTSADPPSVAHRAILRWLSERFDRVAVWASDNPFKSHQTPLEHRAAMLGLTIEELQREDLDSGRCHNLEFHPELSSPRSLTSVKTARALWQNADLTLVIGSDLVSQLPQWYRVDELLELVTLLVIPRPGAPIDEADMEQLRQMGRVDVADLHAPDVSSTAYRQSRDSGKIPPSVEAYIDREKLYA
ncbi:nicotinate-nucleotide adenylyltransferase [Baaleninema sp.]|uniref:nicotinate-nucleotide adenylyltransferase n=1 Tax=Baaleninema sp. TaxID=3101197 RepID=UPI003D035D7D